MGVRKMKLVAVVFILAVSLACTHQSNHADPHAGHNMMDHSATGAGYSDMTEREIKALSKEEMAGLLDGLGLGMALPAELNGYPGPMHVLELKDKLSLTAEQIEKTEKLFSDVRAEAKKLGAELVESERKLDLLFKEKRADDESVSAAAEEAGILRGRVRAAHLKYHLRMMDVLTPEQVAKYQELRGYSKTGK
jgi:Spy/CpxP family protein refolding chaperone